MKIFAFLDKFSLFFAVLPYFSPLLSLLTLIFPAQINKITKIRNAPTK